MNNPLESMSNTASNAMKGWNKVLMGDIDTDLDLYNSLSTDNLTAIMKEYGVRDTVDYIQAMESRKMRGNYV